ncbi:MAG: hypothetical protein FJ291_14855 [Planctomycetes bacterium]|nr:hypothetical protein [Planctomycetota bacterium]
MSTTLNKDEAHSVVDRMPEGATWDDLIHEIYVREVIDNGLADSREGRTRDVHEVRERYGIVQGVPRIHNA